MISNKGNSNLDGASGFSETTPVLVVVIYLIYQGKVILFERDDARVGTVSGKVRPGEGFRNAAARELKEETCLFTSAPKIGITGHCFNAISPKGKHIFGVSLFAILEHGSCDLFTIRLNKELLDYQLVSADVAVKQVERYGHPESHDGVKCVLNKYMTMKNEYHKTYIKGGCYA